MNYKKITYWINRKIYTKVLSNETVIFRGLKKGDTIIDLGCGENSFLRHHKGKYETTGIDIHKKAISTSREKKIHEHYQILDVTKAHKKFGDKSFDAVFCFDLIEHLTKRQGLKLLSQMEQMARKKIVIQTPNGFYKQKAFGGNRHQEHKSSWDMADFRDRGYNVYGSSGFKFLFKQASKGHKMAQIIISDMSMVLFTRKHPEYDFHLLAIKNIKSQ